MIATTVPFGRTARRLEWAHLPPHVRALVERECGSAVVEATSQGGGFTPGFASVLRCEDGSRHFVKAASTKAQRAFALSYREEARKLGALPPEAPAPRLLWLHDRDDWVVLGIEHVEAATPRRPWRVADVEGAAAMLESLAATLTPVPPALDLAPVADDLADWPAAWDHLRLTRPDLPHLDDAAGLAASFAAVGAGDTVVHTDVRDDNLLLAADGRVLLCDWNWPVLGAAWLDTVLLMVGPRGDGLDVDALLARLPLTRDVPADHVDAFLALLAGYFWKQGDERVPPASPYLRDFQRWQGDVVWDWLAERRGWHDPA
ncbi:MULTISPECIES: phosphotransferase family protein [unclassified Nocardioides]|uniref:phosphotransferase family protein n=1 Tax=unclassified Nocardioides TaxID=2615069 RepID=UPI00301490E2